MSYKEEKIKDICRLVESLAVGSAKFNYEMKLSEMKEDFIRMSASLAEEYQYDPVMIKTIKLNNKFLEDIVKISQDVFELATKYEEELTQ